MRQPLPDMVDFAATSGMWLLPDLHSTVEVSITPLTDQIPEHQEEFIVQLMDVSGKMVDISV